MCDISIARTRVLPGTGFTYFVLNILTNHFKAAALYWGQTTYNLSGLPPKLDCCPKRVNSDTPKCVIDSIACVGARFSTQPSRRGYSEKVSQFAGYMCLINSCTIVLILGLRTCVS